MPDIFGSQADLFPKTQRVRANGSVSLPFCIPFAKGN